MECSIPVVGNGMTLGVTDGTNLGGYASAVDTPSTFISAYGTSVGTSGVSAGNMKINCTYGVTKDSSKSGLVGVLPSLSINSKELGRWFIRF